MNTTPIPHTSLMPLEPLAPRHQETHAESEARIKAIRIAEKNRVRWAGDDSSGHNVRIPQYVLDAVYEALLESKHDSDNEIDFYTHAEQVVFNVLRHDSQGGVEVFISYKNRHEDGKQVTLIGSRDTLWELYSVLGSHLAKTKANPIAAEKKHAAPTQQESEQSFSKSMAITVVWIAFISIVITVLFRG